MPATLTPTLNPLQKNQIQSINADFPTEDADLFALYETEESIRSAAAFFLEGEDLYECYAFTEPSFRRQGLFTRLLDLAIDELPEDSEFIFYTNKKSPDTLEALDALGAELVLEEHMMELDLKSWKSDSSKASDYAFTVTNETVDDTLTRLYSSTHGSVKISVFVSHYYLYGLEIFEEYRGQGYGKALLLQVISDLISCNPLPLRLQVSGENIPAVSLYKKTGFQIAETLSGYLY